MLCNLHEWHAPCRDLCKSLTQTLVAEVKATAFYSPAGCQGLDTHRDDAHVFVAQLSGAKRWSVFDEASDPRSRRIGRVEREECGSETAMTLGPGDGLYLPPYRPHHASAVPTSNSLHLSIHVREPRVRDVLDGAIDQAMSAALQRTELTGDAARRAGQVRDLLQSLAGRLLELDPMDVVDVIERRITGR
jgi:ribosomal protein L16 Arg81 hydroxylase